MIVKDLLPYENFVSFDLEWEKDIDDFSKIWEAGFVNHLGHRVVIHEDDFPSHEDFIKAIFDELSYYECKIGWNILGKESDTYTLYQNAKLYFPEQDIPMRQDFQGTWVFKKSATIDLMQVYGKRLVQFSVFNEKYRNLKLESVAQAFLGRGKTGQAINIRKENIEKQKEYVLEDAQLVRELLEVGEKTGSIKGLKHEGGLMGLMFSIYKIIEDSRIANKKPEDRKMHFDRVCNTNITTWWARILDNYNAKPADPRFKPVNYKGGFVMEPERGYYLDMDVLDVQSLYPTAIINYNLSHEVMCCDHPECKHGKYKIPGIELWACERKEGIFAKLMKGYKSQRVKEKEAGNELMAQGLKIFLNGGYGAYGAEFFKYADVRVAESTTAIGRYITMEQLKPKAESLGIFVKYGDTDSLFTIAKEKSKIKELIEWAKEKLDIVLEYEKTFIWCILVGKKHYLGRTTKGKLMVKGIEGMKKDRCKWVRDTFYKVVDAIEKKEVPNIPYFNAVNDLKNDKVPQDDLKFYVKLSKNPEEYEGNCQSKSVGMLHQGIKNDVLWFFKGKKATLEYSELDKQKYIDNLESVVKDIIEIMGYDTNLYKSVGMSAYFQ